MKILLIVSLASLSFAAMADDVVPVDKVKNWINVRQIPDTNAEIVGRLEQGASLPLVSTLDGWYEVELDGTTGFVSADWAKIVAATGSDTEVAEAAADPGAEIAEHVDDDRGVDRVAGSADEGRVPDAEIVAEEAEEIVEAVDAEPIEAIEAIDEEDIEEGIADVDVADQAPALHDTELVSGPAGPPGPPGPPGAASIKGSQNFLVKFRKETEGGSSQIYDNGNQVGIGTTDPKQRLEVNGSIQIHEQNSSVAGLMITQSAGDTGYIMHNRASTLTIGAGSQDRITIDRDGNVGIGAAKPSHPLEMASGAHATAGGVWTNASSRDKKENIAALTAEQAMAALAELEPVRFNYRNERQEGYVGFIAEDVPELVATKDRQTLSAMDIVAVLTKVVQAQQQRIDELEARLDATGRRP